MLAYTKFTFNGRCVINPGRARSAHGGADSDGTVIRRGDVVRIETGGGGGFGHPFDREGRVGAASAERDYGVVLTPDLTIDQAATRRRRDRGAPIALFHRGRYRDTLD